MLRTILASTVLAVSTAGFAFAAGNSDQIDPAAEPVPQPDAVTEGKADQPEETMTQAASDVSGTEGQAPSAAVDEVKPDKETNVQELKPKAVDEESDNPTAY